MNTKKILFGTLILGLLAAQTANGQTFSKDVWHDGEADLFSGETLRGKLKYDLETNNLQLTNDGTLKSYSSFQVASFQFFDALAKVPRTFYTLPYQRTADYNSPVFFELFADGESLSLLNREVVIQRAVNPMGMWGGWGFRPMGMSMPVIEDVYFVLNKGKETVIKLADQRGGVLALMPDYQDEVANFMKQKKLNPNQRNELIQIMNYYNSLKKGDH